MVKKIIKSSILDESKISWIKIVFAILAGLFLGYFILGSNSMGMTFSTVFDFVVLSLLACIMALLLDIRRLMISNFGKC